MTDKITDVGTQDFDETQDVDIDVDGLDEENDPAVLREKLKTTVFQKKHYREKYGKLKDDPRLQEVKEKPPEPKPKAKNDTSIDPEQLRSEIREEMRVLEKHKLSESELSRAYALAKAEGKTLSEVSEDRYFQTFLRETRSEAAAEAARPGSSPRSGNGSAKYGVDDLADSAKVEQMSPKEYAELIEKASSQRPLSSH